MESEKVDEGWPRIFVKKLLPRAKIEWLHKKIKIKSMDKRNTEKPREHKMYYTVDTELRKRKLSTNVKVKESQHKKYYSVYSKYYN